jgi:hypothetical protein
MKASRSRELNPDALVFEMRSVTSKCRSKTRSAVIHVLTFVALLGVARPAQASTIIYTLEPLTGMNGSILTGTITINDADNNGAIVGSEIVAWSFSSEGPVGFSFGSGSSGAGFQCLGSPGCFTATATTLAFNFGSTTPNNPFANFFVSGNALQFLETAQGGPNPVSWNAPASVDRGHWVDNVFATAPAPVSVTTQTWTQIKTRYR